LLAWTLLAWIGAVGPASAGEAATVEVVEGPRVVVRATGRTVLVPACRGVIWEAFDLEAKTYAPLPDTPCGIGAAHSVDAEGQTFVPTVEIPPRTVVRAVVVVGEGCADGMPFELAECKRISAVVSRNLTVRGDDEP